MADNLGGLFDSDPGFLEELASGAEESQPMSGMIPQQNIAMMPQQQGQPQPGGYNMPANNFNPNMQYANPQQQQQQQPNPQQPQQFHQQPGYNQYNNQQMYNQGGAAPVMAASTAGHVPQPQGHMMPQPQQNPTQFNQQSAGGAMMQHQGQQVMYPYNAGGTNQGPGSRPQNPAAPQQQQPAVQQQQQGGIKVVRLTQQQQQQQGWNQNQQMAYNQQQQQPQTQQQYMPHQDYAVTNATGQQQMPLQQQQPQQQYPNSQPPQSQAAFMQRMTSPTRLQTSQPSQQPMMGMPQQQQQQQQMYNQQNNVMNPAITQQQGAQQPQQAGFMPQQPGQQPTSSAQYQQFPYRSPPQGHPQAMGDKMATTPQQQNPGMRFPQTSPTQQNVQMGMQYNNMNMAQQRGANPMLSPRPTPPPQSPAAMLSPTGSTSSQQGNFNSMEPNQPVQHNNMNMFQQTNNTESVINDLNQPSFASQQNDQILSPNGPQPNGNIPNTFQNGQVQTQVSPSFKVMSPPAGSSPQNGSAVAEVAALNQQIQHLYSLPQTPQNQQKLLDLQEKMRQVKAGQPGPGATGGPQGPSPAVVTTTGRGKGKKQTVKVVKMQQQQMQGGKPMAAMLQQQQMQQQQQQQPGMMQGQVQQQQQPGQMMPQQQKTIVQQQQMGQSGGTVTFQLSSGQAGKQVQPGSKIHLVPSTGPQKVFIIQQQQQNAQAGGQQAQPGSQSQTMVSSSSIPQPQSGPGANPGGQTQHIIINSNSSPAKTQHIVIQNASGMQQQMGADGMNKEGGKKQQQEKANKIIAEAIAKAQKSGTNKTLPRVLDPPDLPATLGDLDNPELMIAEGEKPKKKRKRTPKKDKDGNEIIKVKTPKSSKKSKKAKKAAEIAAEEAIAAVIGGDVKTPDPEMEVDIEGISHSEGVSEGETPKKPKKKKKADGEKRVRIRPPKSSKKAKLPPATFLKNKKRKRLGSSDGSDVEIKITPPPSPENEDCKRRSGRHAKRKKYLDDVDLNLSEEELPEPDINSDGAVVKPVQIVVDNPTEEDSQVVDKILGSRMRKRDPDDEGPEDEEEVEEYFVKYKNYSYLHCEWKTEEEIRDKRIQGKIKRYRQKKMLVTNYFDDDEELFNPDYVEVDRVLEESFSRDPVSGEEVLHYLCKWRSSSYEEATWELQQDVDPEKVKLFKKFREIPPAVDRRRKPRPKPEAWKALDKSHAYKNDNLLREYQLEGVNWLTFCYYKNNNCILADEMGLGKTIQSIAYLQEIFTYGIKGPFLIVVPLSTIANWQREFETWTDMNAITYHGTSPSRYMLQEYEMYYRDEEGNKIQGVYRFHALITTYELILSDIELLRSIEWRALVVDEAHRLKNKNCSLIKCLRIFNCEHKVLLSGTPLQNNVEELFSLLNFLEPTQFNSSEAFNIEFGTLKTEEQVDKLKAILKPMMLRRLKEDVEKNLAAKEETIIEVELTNVQKKYYRAILERNFTYLCKGAQTSGNVPSLMNTMMELRKCCNHPYLIKGAEDNIMAEFRIRDKEADNIKSLIQSSGKFVLLDKLLPKLKQNGNRVLIFSQMIRVLDIIEDYLIHKRYMYERLDGRIRGNLRQEAIDRYSKPDSDRFVFLICTKAGGLGINLTAADTVIIYDSDWNPQNDLQAQARCHRIGQRKSVKVYRLITRNSYEREMFDRASMKLGLDKAVLQSMGSEKGVGPQIQLSKKEVEELLKKGAYGALMEDDEAGDKFCEEDIDQILKGRTQVVQIESEGKGSTFSKASFSVTSNRDDIDINDPEFWQKWAKKADMDVENLDTRELIVDEPRVRKKTARYGNNDDLAEISDLNSDDSDDDKKGKKGGRRSRRNADEDVDFEKESSSVKKVKERMPATPAGYTRSELFKVEKGLLHYGWGRWKDIMAHCRFKRNMDKTDVEKVAKAILMFGLQYYKGDQRIKEFIFDLISHNKNVSAEGLRNHSGLSAPVPRGRKGKTKPKPEESTFDAHKELEKCGIKIDKDIVMNKNAYKRHIQRHSNKVLLRVRTLYYLKHEVLGDVVEQIDQGKNIKDIQLIAPIADTEPPTVWWNELADKSLLVGVYKHGYERYNMMRQDPSLVFLELCGPPDNAALAAEMNDDNENEDMNDTIIKDDEEDESLPAPEGGITPKPAPKPATDSAPAAEGDGSTEEGKLPFPTVSELNTRLRRIITTYQRDYKKQQLKKEAQAKKNEKREKLDAMFREREQRRRETMQKWTRREEMDFYRVVSTYGIEFDRVKGRYIWDRFRVMARLDKKTDEQLTEYFISFYHMCLRVCRKIKEEAYPPTPVYIEPITEERANRCIARIDLLSKIREEIIIHPRMEARIKLCKTSLDLPPWWSPGKHDRELLIGAAKHGLARTDYYIMSDPNLCFLENVKSYVRALSPATVDKDVKKEKSVTPDPDSAKTEKSEDSKVSIKKEPKEEDSSEKDEVKKEGSSEDVKEEKEIKTEKKEEDTEADKDKDKTDVKVKEEKMETDESEAKKSPKKEKESPEAKKEAPKTVMEDVEDWADVEEEPGETKESVKAEKTEEDGVKKEKKESSDTVKSEAAKTEVKSEPKDAAKEEADEEVRSVMDGEESQSELLSNVSETLLTQWPKDRLVFHRLEQICYCVETGEWPFPSKMKSVHILGIDSGSNTPTRSQTPSNTGGNATPSASTSTPASGPSSAAPSAPPSAGATPKPEEVESRGGAGDATVVKKEREDAQKSESDKGTFQNKKPEKPRSSADLEAEKAAKIQAILAQSLAASQAASSDDSQSDAAAFSQVSWPSPWQSSSTPFYLLPQGGAENPFLNGSHMSEEEMLMNRAMMEQGLIYNKSRRGRKRKAEKMAEIAMAEALARRQTARALSILEPDSRVPLINLEDGSRLSGDEAPRKRDLETWLERNPGHMVDTREMDEVEEGEVVSDFPERKKGRKPKYDPSFLEVDKLTGEENVSVVNRLTGKKITGAKAPPLRYLAEWLEQNPMWDVDPKWADLVRAKASLPKTLLPRVLTPSRRGRRPRDSPLSHSMTGGAVTDPHQAAALAASLEVMNAANLMAAGYGKLPMPFGSIPGLGMNPLLGLSGFPFPGMPGASPLPTEKSETQNKDPKCSKEETEKLKEEEASGSGPHPSFPFMFNPLMYNPALLATQGLTNFPLPTSLSSSSPSLINGHPQPDEELAKPSKSRPKDRSDRDQAQDLSVKTKSSSNKVVEKREESHDSSKASKSDTAGAEEGDEMPCDLSMKSKGSSEDKSKQKICSSDKLSRIVDTLKFRVNKMDDIPASGPEDKERRASMDVALSLTDKSLASPPLSKHDTASEPSTSKQDFLNSLSQKVASLSSSSNHAAALAAPTPTTKEPLPKIVEELLAQKHQREKEELLIRQQKKLDSLMMKKEKFLLMEAAAKRRLMKDAQGSSEDGGRVVEDRVEAAPPVKEEAPAVEAGSSAAAEKPASPEHS